MTPALTAATTRRVLTQLGHDRRTIAIMLAVPTLILVLLRYVFDSEQQFDGFAPAMLGLVPFLVMFLVTSVGTLRERTGGTLERLMTLPIGKLDLLLGYAIAFGLVSLAQVAVMGGVALAWLGLDVRGPVWMLFVVAALDAALGLFVSAFARTEFQAVQFMPLVVLPQFLLCGLFTPRESMADFLSALSGLLPLSYAVDAMNEVAVSREIDADLLIPVAVIAGCVLVALALGAATLRRRTP